MCVQPPGRELTAVPTMSEWGLIATALTLGIVSVVVIRRRKGPALKE